MKWQKFLILKHCLNGLIFFLIQSKETKRFSRQKFPSRWIKWIFIVGIIIYASRYFRLLITDVVDNNSTISLRSNNIVKTTLSIEIQNMFDNQVSHRYNKPLPQFSGEYAEISSNSPMNNNIYKYTIEEILFLVTTDTKRIFMTLHYMKFWATRPGINCLIVFEEVDFISYTNISDYLKNEGIHCEIETSVIERYEQRYFELFYQAWNRQDTDSQPTNTKKIQWFAVADDDTIWFINNLLRTLSQYNSSDTIYLGNTSTKKLLTDRHGTFFAYGGAGILFSRPLTLLYAQRHQQCQRFIDAYGGDEMIGKCVTEELKINLTKNKHFHQMDLIGDMIGLIESGMDGLVTLHHMFKIWKPFPDSHIDHLNETIHRLNTSYTIFDKDFLKRYLYVNYKTNQSVLLTMGYSVSIFNRILSNEDFRSVEKTWCCDVLVDRIVRAKETNRTTWYFRRFINDTSMNIIKYIMVYENTTDKHDLYSNIKVTFTL